MSGRIKYVHPRQPLQPCRDACCSHDAARLLLQRIRDHFREFGMLLEHEPIVAELKSVTR